jgi:hypothetical protein
MRTDFENAHDVNQPRGGCRRSTGPVPVLADHDARTVIVRVTLWRRVVATHGHLDGGVCQHRQCKTLSGRLDKNTCTDRSRTAQS